MKRLLPLLVLLAAAPVFAQTMTPIYCVLATLTVCNTISNPGNHYQGDQAWQMGGKLNAWGTQLGLFTNQPANEVLATPSGTTGIPGVRQLVGADIPPVNLAGGNENGGVVGNLPPANLNSGMGASNSTFWRGDGTWATPAGAPVSPSYGVGYNNGGTAWGSLLPGSTGQWCLNWSSLTAAPTLVACSGGAPAGSNYAPQYNNSGTLAGINPGSTAGIPLISGGSSSPSTFGALNLGLAGAVSGVLPQSFIGFNGFNCLNPQSGTTYSVLTTDAWCLVAMSNAATNVVTMPSNATAPVPVNSIVYIEQSSTGMTCIGPGSGATFVNGGATQGACSSGNYQLGNSGYVAMLGKTGTNQWTILNPNAFVQTNGAVTGNGTWFGCKGQPGQSASSFPGLTCGVGPGTSTGIGVEDGGLYAINSYGMFFGTPILDIQPDATNVGLSFYYSNPNDISGLAPYIWSMGQIQQTWETLTANHAITYFTDGTLTFTSTPITTGTLSANFTGPTGTWDIYWNGGGGGFSQGHFTNGSTSVTSITVPNQGAESTGAAWLLTDAQAPGFDFYSGYFLSATSAGFTVTLPAASSAYVAGSLNLQFDRIDATTNTVTIAAAGSDKIDGSSTITIGAGVAFTLQSDGTGNWHRVNSYGAPVGCSQTPAWTGDVTTTAGSCATTVSKVNGASVPASAPCVATNSSSQFTSAASCGATLQTGGTNNTSQTTLNLVGVTGVSVTNPSGGTVDIATAEPVNPQTGTTYTIATTDCGKQVTFSNASAIAVTVPQATSSFATCQFDATDLGAGTATLTPTTSTVNGQSSLAIPTNQQCTLNSDGTNWQVIACFPAMGSHTYLVDNGPQYTVSGTGACSAITKTGSTGSANGEFECTGTTGSSTITLTLPSSVNNWACFAHDVTTTANTLAEGAGSSTSDTFSGTVNANDFIKFGCTGF